jgi:hypothetical protein
MNFKTTIVLLIALLVVGSFFLFAPKNNPQPSQDNGQVTPGQGKKIIDMASADVKGITIADADGNRTSVRQEGAGWKMNEPVSAPAVDWQTSDLIRTICDLRSMGQPSSTPSDAGLDKPRYTVDLIGSNGRTTRLVIGNPTSIGDTMYAQVDGGDINLIDSSLAKTLKTAADDLRDKHLLTASTADVKQVKIVTPTQSLEAIKQGDRWLVTRPVQVPGDSDAISSLISSIVGTEASEFVKSDSEELAFAGFSHPTMTVTLSTAEPTTQPAAGARPTTGPESSAGAATQSENALTMTIGAPDSLTKDHYFVQTSTGLVGKIAKSSLDALQKTPLDLRDKDVASVPSADVTSISIVKTTYPPLSSAQATQPSAIAANQRPLSTHIVVLGLRPKAPVVQGPTFSGARPSIQPSTQPSTQRSGSTQPATAESATAPATQPAANSLWMFAIPGEPKSNVDDSKVDALLSKFSPLRADKFLEKLPETAVDSKFIVTLETKSLSKYHIEVFKPASGGTPYASFSGLFFEVPTTLLDSLDTDFHKTP